MSISHVPMSQVYLPPFVGPVHGLSQQTHARSSGSKSKTTQKVGFRSVPDAEVLTLTLLTLTLLDGSLTYDEYTYL